VSRKPSVQAHASSLAYLIGTAAACSLLAPDDDELLSDRGRPGGEASDSGGMGAAGGGASGSGGSSNGAGGTSSGASGAGGSSGAGESGRGGAGGSGASSIGGRGGKGIDGVPGETGGTDGGSFSIPTAGLVLWLKADAGVTTVSGLVSEWRDQSGNNHHAAQALAAAQPSVASPWRASKPAVRFDGAQDFLNLPAMRFGDFRQGLSVFVVADTAGSSSCIPFIQFSNGEEVDDIAFYRDPNGGMTYEVMDTSAICNSPIFPLQTPTAAAVVQTSMGLATVYVDGAACAAETIDPPGSAIRDNVSIGRVPYPRCATFAGNIAELLVYGRALSLTETGIVQSYLAGRWVL
jgi:hypothetical protein